MDKKQYKKVQTRRGYTYSYYLANEHAAETLLFLHGFPSTSQDWSLQVEYFSAKGYKIVAPDLLGYGESSKPADPVEYKTRGIVNDIVDILDAEHIAKVTVIAHDWGSVVSSRLLNFHQDRLVGVAFLSVGYVPPQPDFDYETSRVMLNSLVGYDIIGYWEYFAASDAPSECEQNIDSFYSLVFPKDPSLWKTDLSPRGKAREWIEHNKQAPLPSYWDKKARSQHQELLLSGGLRGPMNWYTSKMKGLDNEDESYIPEAQYAFSTPCFFGAALQDYASLAAANKFTMQKFATNLVMEDFDTSHWIMFEASAALNMALDAFVSGLRVG